MAVALLPATVPRSTALECIDADIAAHEKAGRESRVSEKAERHEKVARTLKELRAKIPPQTDLLAIADLINDSSQYIPRVPNVAPLFKHALEASNTNIDGKYRLEDIPAGDYIVAGATGGQLYIVMWFVPVTIEADEEVNVDLFNDNAFFINENR
jgi:hypothetical protein